MIRNQFQRKVRVVPSTVNAMQTACRLESMTVCCPKRRKDGRAKARRLHKRTHYGAGELHALQRDEMEDGAARGWGGGPRGRGVRLRNGGARDAGGGARANSEALRAL